MKEIGIVEAIHSLAPGAAWEYIFDTETLTWFSEDVAQPTPDAIDSEIIRLKELAVIEAAAEEQRVSDAQATKASALAKLARLGLTEEEARIIAGA